MKDLNPKTLVVDDNDEILIELEKQLKSLDYKEVHIINNAKDALVKISEASQTDAPFQLVLSDWHMPEMSGLEFLNELKKDPETVEIPFIMVSAETDSKDILLALKNGADNYIIKPTTKEKLAEKIDMVLSEKRVEEAPKEFYESISQEEAEEISATVSDTKIHIKAPPKLVEETEIGPEEETEEIVEEKIEEKIEKEKIALAQETYLEDYDLLKEIFNSTRDFLIIIDNNNKITRVNPAVCGKLSYDAGDLVGLSLDRLFPDDIDCPDVEENSWRNFRGDLLSIKKEKVPVSITTSILNDKEGNITGAILTAQDLRKELELEKMMKHAEEMSEYGKAVGDAPNEIQGPLSDILGSTEEIEKLLKGEDISTDTQGETTSLFITNISKAAINISEILKGIKEKQKKLVESAHSAGMAEIASGILHNIGNVANSLNVSILSLKSIIYKSRIDWLIKANELVQENKKKLAKFLTKDKKGKELPDLYLEIGDSLQDENINIKENVESMVENINVIKNIIEGQRNYAFGNYFNEQVDLAELVEKTIASQKDFINLHNLNIETIFTPISEVTVHKTKLINIIINLLKNSQEALTHNDEDNREILIEIGQNQDEAYLIFQDNGEGIPKENLDKVVNLKFTTKEEGSGIGLHTVANSLTEMNGRMEIKSEGQGKGATFILYFPMTTEQKLRAIS